MPLDKATADFVARMAESGAKPRHEMSVEEARTMSAQVIGLLGSGPEMARVTDGRVQVPGGSFPYRILEPGGLPKGIIVFYHGGGWVLGDIESSEGIARTLAARTSCLVMVVGYRKAPEYRFPVAVIDAFAALQWAANNLEQIAGRKVPLIVAGESAGGNLAAVMAHWARREGGPQIALQVLVCPATDCDLDGSSYNDPENQVVLTRELVSWFWGHYAPDPQSREHPDASPLRSPDFTGLPPAVILTAEYDVLRAEGEMYGSYLLKAGVPVEYLEATGKMHGFFSMGSLIPGSEIGIDFVAAAINAALIAAPTQETSP